MSQILASDQWILGIEEDGFPLCIAGLWLDAFMKYFPEFSGLGPYYHIEEFTLDRHFRWYIPEQYSEEMAKALLQKVLDQPSFFADLRVSLTVECQELMAFSQVIANRDPSTIPTQEILALFATHKELVEKIIARSMISVLTDIPHPFFTDYLTALLAKKVADKNLSKGTAEYFAALSAISEESIQRLEVKNMYRLALLSQQNQDLAAAVTDHQTKYEWAYYGYVGPALTKEKIIQQIQELTKENKDLASELARLEQEPELILRNRIQAETELGLSEYEKQLFQAVRDTVFKKICRRDAMAYSFFVFEKVRRELATRIGISYQDAEYLAPHEYELAAAQDTELLADLPTRREYSVYAVNTTVPHLYSGETAREFLKQHYQPKIVEQVKEFKGQPACLGEAEGIVRIINVPADLHKMEPGNILVSIATTPDIVSAMKIAGAIVTEMGGITSHAAIVSRELGVPCVIGTKIATKVLKDGDRVRVNARTGLVTIID